MVPERAYALDADVAVRPEPFGALCYHYGNRRLTFLKSPEIVEVVQSLGCHESVTATLTACGIEPGRWPAFLEALASLEASEVIGER
jgi:putative mycofactocin binding protein MftB